MSLKITWDKCGYRPLIHPSPIAPRAKTAASLSFQASSPVADNFACKESQPRSLSPLASLCVLLSVNYCFLNLSCPETQICNWGILYLMNLFSFIQLICYLVISYSLCPIKNETFPKNENNIISTFSSLLLYSLFNNSQNNTIKSCGGTCFIFNGTREYINKNDFKLEQWHFP